MLLVKVFKKRDRVLVSEEDNKGVINFPEPAGRFDGRGVEGF